MPSKEEVKYIGHLARIHLNDDEIDLLVKNLEDILLYVEKLQKLNVNDVKPTSHVLPLKNVFREDVVRPSLKQEEVAKFSVAHHNGSFKVPQVIE
ncbi:MAG TPA: Asp-tRNA(Asn)/Glu-tRNA(Gln) amidotransferase subunit GatC [Candidatus Omnitrophota bacterium]|nr:Asp-tRNA(Asn)/Glu-tRNA(Gln) amidotransferase subunit GatC [Candidatus Omnitrophota bacterium]HPD85282.1 Asp-tRNA(Asn)/Glu-tRNA(Gln) amidotransferase subunit GatC [Candidatus Omnitrophota bacterium]HRZ04217.1 Asp-tRNA(Asn)/Glu-tRNA(Gln) amidotransferase subunit GatC [Candidatus Omnitrophota bacterium]